MKISISHINTNDASFRFTLSDIDKIYYGATIGWRVYGIAEPDTNRTYSEQMGFTIPYNVSEYTSGIIDSYIYMTMSPDGSMTNSTVGYFQRDLHYTIGIDIYRVDGVSEPLDYLDLVFKLNPNLPSVIFNAKQVQAGSNDVYCTCKVHNVSFNSRYTNEYTSIEIYQNNTRVTSFILSEIEDGSYSSSGLSLTLDGDIVSWTMLTGEIGKTYKFYVIVTNHLRPTIETSWNDPSVRRASKTSEIVEVTLIQEGMPECYMNVMYKDVAAYEFVSMERIGTIKDYPEILASQWNQFCKDVNVVRRKAGLSEYYFDEVSQGTKFDYMLFYRLYEAVVSTCPSGIVIPPQDNIGLFSGVDAGGPAVKLFISNLVNALQDCRDYYWSIS